ncbi:MAG: motility protein A [Phycisphaerae bacterium]|nr:motility protein A [Phycisphaerae bacterium]
MDLATIIGILAGFACIASAIVAGGSAGVFVNVPSVMIVIGGMLSATLIHFSIGQVLGIFSVVKKTLFCKLPDEQDLIQKMVNYAAINRRDGALALERQVDEAGDSFLVQGMQMVIDGQSEDAIGEHMDMEIRYLQQRHSTGKKVLEFMGASAPAFGMIGTLIGLVQMLGTLEDPSQIGVGMATALITTFYGAFVANLVFIPLAGKLGIRSKRETLLREMILEGLLGLVRGQSPTEVRERMHAFVSGRKREELKPNV